MIEGTGMAEDKMGVERRRERRIPMESILLPFIGTRDDNHAHFQYLPIDISVNGMKIALPQWLISRESFDMGSIINLHAPFRLGKKVFRRGEVRWSSWDEKAQSQICGLELEAEDATIQELPVYFSFETKVVEVDLESFECREDLLKNVFKDTYLLKRGVSIYLRHLIPYFARTGGYPTEEYPQLRALFLDDILKRVKANSEKLERQYEGVKDDCEYQEEISRHLDLEELRETIISEIYSDIFVSAFEAESVMMYLGAIKSLEDKLYNNYNTIVMLYIQSLR